MTSKDLSIYISDFFRYADSQRIELYNEFSLQHELGIYLRNRCPNYSVQFERNINYFFGINTTTVKKEIDITVYDKNEKFAIELKFPRNGAYPKSMFQFVEDIRFIEQLNKNGFTGGCAVVLVDDMNFCSNQGLGTTGIYSYFRSNNPITGIINNPNQNVGQAPLTINGSYNVIWKSTNIWDRDNVADPIKSISAQYYIIEV
jgi:hypothetical protein